MLKHGHQQRGVTLVELMIASTIALIALSAALTLYLTAARHGGELLQQAHLHQQLHALVHLLSRDLSRAGYWHFNPSLKPPTANPFQDASNRIQLDAYPGERPQSCILFSYDLDRDGLVGLGACGAGNCPEQTDEDNVERFGFRLRGSRIQSRYGGPELTCSSGYWQTLNDTSMEITRLRFIQHTHCLNLLNTELSCTPESPGLMRRAIEVRIGAQLANRPDTGTLVSQWVRIRNDLLREGQAW
jgi:prepilin-type N-terminal cleavage/methylation domain-containing protein